VTAQMQAAQQHSVYRMTLQTHARATLDSATLGPKNECHQTNADPDTVHTSITRAEFPPTDFACFASAPSGNSFAQAASISADFSRVSSAEDRAFARPDPAAPQPPLHGPRPVSEAQTLIGAQLPLLPDHPAASWLSTSWMVPGLADLLGQSSAMPPTLPSPDAARWRSHGIHSATPAPQPPPLHAEATLAATPRAGPKRSFASMDVRQPDGDPAVCDKRAEYPSTDFACFASAPSGNSFAQAASISTDFSRVTSEENRAFARLLSSSAHGTSPGFLVGGAGARDSHACEFPMASQAGGGIAERTEAGHSFPRAESISSDLARLTPEGDRVLSNGVHFPQPGSEG